MAGQVPAISTRRSWRYSRTSSRDFIRYTRSTRIEVVPGVLAFGEHRREVCEIRPVGIVLINLGGPDSLQAVKPFLYNLFSDRKIIKLGPLFLQRPLAWLISSLRSGKTERMYRLIGGKSPILDITKAQADALEKALNKESAVGSQALPEDNPPIPPLAKGGKGGFERAVQLKFRVFVGMRYWRPFIEDTVKQMYDEGVSAVLAISLYPHYSLATTGSALEKFKEVIAEYPMESSSISSWHDHPQYIEALAESIRKGLASFGSRDVEVLFSAHSLPLRIVESGDPYVSHIRGTIDEIVKMVDIRWHLSYQSKSGPVKWLEPSTDDKIRELAGKGVKNLLVVPVSFVSDHIETLYEIDILYNGLAGMLGMKLIRAESLNTNPLFIKALEDMVTRKIKELGWTE
jgi:ferrochelatase